MLSDFDTFLAMIPVVFLIWGKVLLIKGQRFEDGHIIYKGLTFFIPVIVVFGFVSFLNKSILVLPNQPGYNINLFFYVCLAILSLLTFIGIAAYYISKDVPEVISKAGIAISAFAIVIFVVSAGTMKKDGTIRLTPDKSMEFRVVDDNSDQNLSGF